MNDPDYSDFDDFDPDLITEDDCSVEFEMGEDDIEKINLDKLRNVMRGPI